MIEGGRGGRGGGLMLGETSKGWRGWNGGRGWVIVGWVGKSGRGVGIVSVVRMGWGGLAVGGGVSVGGGLWSGRGLAASVIIR